MSRMTRLATLLAACALFGLPELAEAQRIQLKRRPGPMTSPPHRPAQPVALKHLSVKATIKEQVAETTIDQVFHNPNNWIASGTYLFPLPSGTTISNFNMFLGGKPVVGEVLGKDKARQVYQNAVRSSRNPGLLEFVGHQVIRAQIPQIPAQSDMRIKISFTRVLKAESGWLEYNYPLSSAGKTINEVSFDVSIENKSAIKNVYCPSHAVHVERKTDHLARVRYEKTSLAAERSFSLLFSTSDAAVGMSSLVHRRKAEDGYFMLAIAPKVELKPEEIQPKRIVFVLDTSGSMAGPKMEQARKALEYCVNSLNPKDSFNIVRFSTEVESLDETKLLTADDAGRKKAMGFIDDLDAAGGTNIDEALEKALTLLGKDKGEVVFLTDGKPTIGERDPNEILNNADRRNKDRRARVFVFGVGENLNTHLLDKLAEAHSGTRTYVSEKESIERKVSSFYNKVKSPVLTDLALDFGELQVKHVFPRRLPDLFVGSQLLIFGRYRGEGGEQQIQLSGMIGDKKHRFSYKATFAKATDDNTYLPRLWAQRKVGNLLDQIRLHGHNDELKKEIIELGKRFGIITPYTSALVMQDGARPALAQKLARRAGWGGGKAGAPGARVNRDAAKGENKDKKADQLAQGGERPAEGAAAPAKPNASPADRKEQLERERKQSEKQMKATSGRDAVELSKALKRLRESRNADDEDSARGLGAGNGRNAVRRVDDRAFVMLSGTWVESTLLSKDDLLEKATKIEYLSDAYFALAAKDAGLARCLKLGERLIISHDGVVYSIAPAEPKQDEGAEKK